MHITLKKYILGSLTVYFVETMQASLSASFDKLRDSAERENNWSELAVSLKKDSDELEDKSFNNLETVLDAGLVPHADWKETCGKDAKMRLSEVLSR